MADNPFAQFVTPKGGDEPNPFARFAEQPATPVNDGSDAETAMQVPFGMYNAAASVLGAPVDFMAGQMQKVDEGVKGQSIFHGITPDSATLGSAWWKRRLGAFKANPDAPENQPKTPMARVMRGAGEAAGYALVPETMGSKALGAGSTAAETAANVATQGFAGATGEVAAENVPDEWKPTARLVGNIAGSVAPTLATSGAEAATRALRPEGQKRVAGEKLLAAATDPDTAVRQMAGAEDGSLRTAAQETDDMGLYNLERSVAQRNPEAFMSRRAEQNAQRLDTLDGIEATGDPGKVSAALKSHLDDIDTQTERALTAAMEKARGEASALPSPTAEAVGQRILRDVEPKMQAADSAARGSLDGIGGQGRPADYGASMRAALQSAEDSARAREGALWRAIDPEGNLVGNGTPIAEAASRIKSEIGDYTKPMGEEAALVSRAIDFPALASFKDITDLKSWIATELRTELMRNGRSPAYRRLSILRDAVQKSISESVDTQAAKEAEQVAKGVLDPKQTLEYRVQKELDRALKSAGPAPVSLVQYLRAKGGIKDDGGELRSRDFIKRHPGLVNNKNGMPLDRAREAALDAGYLQNAQKYADEEAYRTGRAASGMSDSSVDDLLSALEQHPRYSIHDEDLVAARAPFQRDATAEVAQWRDHLQHELASVEIDPRAVSDDILDRAVEKLVLGKESDPLTAYERAAIEAERAHEQSASRTGLAGRGKADGSARPDAREKVRNSHSYGTADKGQRGSRAEAGASGIQKAPIDDAARSRIAAANEATKERVSVFGRGPAQQILRKRGQTDYLATDSAVPSKVFASGDQGADKVRAFLKAASGDKDAEAALHDYVAYSLRQAAGRDGVLDPGSYSRWLNSHRQALDALPKELRQRFDTAAKASRAMSEFKAFRNAGPGAVPGMFFMAGPEGAAGVRQLASVIGKDKATAALSDHAAGEIVRRAMMPDGTLDPKKVETFIKAHGPALSELPGLKEKFASAAKATQAVAEAAARRKALLDDAQKSAFGKIIGVSPDEVVDRVGAMLRGNRVSDLAALKAKVASNPEALAGLRRAGVEFIKKAMISTTEAGTSGSNVISRSQFERFLTRNKAALNVVFDKDQVAAMDKIAADMSRANRSLVATKIPSGSDTASNLAQQGRYQSTLSVLKAAGPAALAGLGTAALTSITGGIAGAVSVGVLQAMRNAGLKRVDDIIAEAMLDPRKAAALMQNAKSKMAERAIRDAFLRSSMFAANMARR